MAEIMIRDAGLADVRSISEIYNEAVLTTTASYDYEPEPLERRLGWFAEHEALNLPMYVAVSGSGEVVGWSSLSPFHRRPGFRFTVENSIYLAPNWRGQGIGRQLLEPLIRRGEELGLRSIIAAVDATNPASLRLHVHCGFKEVGRLPQVGYKFDRWLELVYLQRLLVGAGVMSDE